MNSYFLNRANKSIATKEALLDLYDMINRTKKLDYTTKDLRELKVYSYSVIPTILRRAGYIDDNNILIKKIDLSITDTESLLREYAKIWKKKAVGRERRNRVISTNKAPFILSELNKMQSFTDKQIVEELRSRGYEVKCIKQIEL